MRAILTEQDEQAWAMQYAKRNIGYAGTWAALTTILVLIWSSGVLFGYFLGGS